MRRPLTASPPRARIASATPAVEACARCAAPKASFTKRSVIDAHSPARAGSFLVLPRQKANVFEEESLSLPERFDRLPGPRPDRLREEGHVTPEERREPSRDGPKGERLVREAGRAAEVRQHGDAGPALEKKFDRGERSAQARILGDRSIPVAGKIEVGPQEDPASPSDGQEGALRATFSSRRSPT